MPDTLLAAARDRGLPVAGPAEPEDRWYQHDGLRLHHLAWPEMGNPPLLLLHGGTQMAHSWDLIALALHDRFDVYAPDLRGHGDSDWSGEGRYRLSDYVDDILALMDVIGRVPVVIVGLSLGARIGLAATSLRPETVERLVLVDIGMARTWNAGHEQIRRFRQAADEMEFDRFVQLAREFNPRRTEEQLRVTLRNHLRPLPSGLWTWKYDRRFRTEGTIFTPESEMSPAVIAGKIQVRTLVIRGAVSDVTSPESARELADALPNGTLVEVPDAGHTVPGDNPLGFFDALTQFLAREQNPQRLPEDTPES